MEPLFEPGNNIAMKIPTHEYERTVDFYRTTIGLKEITPAQVGATPRFEFGDKTLWLDAAPGLSQSEIWLQIVTNNIEQAARYFDEKGCYRRDDIESLPESFNAFWLSSPSNIIHLVAEKAQG